MNIKNVYKKFTEFILEKEWTELAALTRKFMTVRQNYLRRDILSPYPWKSASSDLSLYCREKK